MSRFKVYSPDQAYLLPPSVRDELGSDHVCFFVRSMIERLDMSVFEQSYSAEGALRAAVDVGCAAARLLVGHHQREPSRRFTINFIERR